MAENVAERDYSKHIDAITKQIFKERMKTMRPNKLTNPRPVSWDEVPIIMDVEYAAAYIFDVTAATVRNWIREKQLPVFKCTDEKTQRIEKALLLKWITDNTQKKG